MRCLCGRTGVRSEEGGMYIAAQSKPSLQVTSHVHKLAFRPMHNCVLTGASRTFTMKANGCNACCHKQGQRWLI